MIHYCIQGRLHMDILLENITLVDGTGRTPQTGAVVALRDGKILYAGPASGWVEPREEVIVLDLAGQFVLPGLIDAHVHLTGSGEPDSRFHGDAHSMPLTVLRNAQKNLVAGITTVRDLGGWNETEFVVREVARTGCAVHARIQVHAPAEVVLARINPAVGTV